MTDVPSPHERPRYMQVADDLRRRIAAGVLPPGAPLPSEPVLMAEFTTSRGTIRDAVAQLRAEGLVVTQQGRGSYVRALLPVTRRSTGRYRAGADPAAPLATAFTADHGVDWSNYELDRAFTRVPAGREEATLFGVEPGVMLLRREFVFRTLGMAQQMSTSSYLLDLVDGTPVADPTNEPWPGGNLAQLRSLGIEATEIREIVRARMPNADETATLGIPTGVPVVVIGRQTFAAERVVEVAEIVIPADRVELEYLVGLA